MKSLFSLNDFFRFLSTSWLIFQNLADKRTPALFLLYSFESSQSDRMTPVYLEASSKFPAIFPGAKFALIEADDYKDELDVELFGYPTVWFLKIREYFEYKWNATVKGLKKFL